MSEMSASEARAALPELLDRVAAGEEVTITRHGRPVAVVVRPDALRLRRASQALASAATVAEILRTGRTVRLSSVPGIDAGRAEELVAEVRSGRDGR